MVVVTGNLGVFSVSRLEKISMDVSSNAGDNNIKLNQVLERVRRLERQEQAFPKSFLAKQRKQRERGIQGGRYSDSAQKQHGEKIRPEFDEGKFSTTESFLIALGLKGKGKKLAADSLLSGAGAPIQKNLAFKNLAAKVTKMEKAQLAIARTVSGSIPLLRGASGLQSAGGLGNMLLTKAAKIGLPTFFITKVAEFVWKQYKAQYGKGGTRDIRKLVLAEDVSRIGIENENELESAANLFLSNPQMLTGLPRGPSNTESLREGMARWKQRHEGTYGR